MASGAVFVVPQKLRVRTSITSYNIDDFSATLTTIYLPPISLYKKPLGPFVNSASTYDEVYPYDIFF
jgi:hypothetical protein